MNSHEFSDGFFGALKPSLANPFLHSRSRPPHRRTPEARRLSDALFANQLGKDLYQFWGDRITEELNKQLKSLKSETLVNLASNEYFKSVNTSLLNAEVIAPAFKDLRGGKYKIISFYAKKARGLMAAYIIQNQIENPEDIKQFDAEGYYYSPEQSTAKDWVFLRDHAE